MIIIKSIGTYYEYGLKRKSEINPQHVECLYRSLYFSASKVQEQYNKLIDILCIGFHQDKILS